MTEWDDRQLCPDGGCVGLIGPDGTCKVCGRAAPGWGDERQRGLILPEPPESPEPPEPEDARSSEPITGALAPPGDDEGWDGRQLCPDGGCLGVIGAAGVCTVCGKPASAQAS